MCALAPFSVSIKVHIKIRFGNNNNNTIEITETWSNMCRLTADGRVTYLMCVYVVHCVCCMDHSHM